MKVTKKFIESLIFFVLSLFLLVISTLAWFASYSETEVNEVVNTVGQYKVAVKLEVKTKYSEAYVEITEHSDLLTLLENSIPNDTFDFKLSIQNQSTSNIAITVIFSEFISQVGIQGYDMLDVFYIVDGLITVEDENEVWISEYYLDYLDDEDTYVDDVLLELYRFSNLLVGDRLNLLIDEALPYQKERVILFTIKFDNKTENVAYEDASFSINTIEIFLKKGD